MCSQCDLPAVMFAGKDGYCRVHALEWFSQRGYNYATNFVTGKSENIDQKILDFQFTPEEQAELIKLWEQHGNQR